MKRWLKFLCLNIWLLSPIFAWATESCELALQKAGWPPDLVQKISGLAQSKTPPLHRDLPPLADTLTSLEIWQELVTQEQAGLVHRLVDTTPDNPDKGYIVFVGRGRFLPKVMQTVGRLREEAFRLVGEGSGQALDLDSYDPYYEQLIAWDKRNQTVSGAYRMGRIPEILKEHGSRGIYTFSLFDFSQLLVGPLAEGSLDMGRSVVRPGAQKGLTLGLMWAGIAKYLALNPEYRHLVGPVSISGDFQAASKYFMTQFLAREFRSPYSDSVRARLRPDFDVALSEAEKSEVLDRVTSLESLQDLVRVIEGDSNLKLPPLIKIYLKLNVKFLDFHWDRDFNTIDGLIWADVGGLPLSILQDFMSPEDADQYYKFHQPK